MRTRSTTIFAAIATLLLLGAGCATSRTNAPAAQPATTPPPANQGNAAVKTTNTPSAAAVTTDDLNKLKAEIQGAKFDDISALK